MRGHPQVPLVVDHQIHQLALAFQIPGQRNDRLIRAQIHAVNAVLLTGDEEDLVFFGIQHLIDLIGNDQVAEKALLLHIIAMNDTGIFRHEKRGAVGIDLNDARI